MANDEAPTLLDRPPLAKRPSREARDEPTVDTVFRGDADATGETQASQVPSRVASVEHETSLVASPREALQQDEIARSRTLATVALILSPITGATVAAIGGDRLGVTVALAGLALLFAVNVLLFFIATPERYTPRRVAAIWFLATSGLLGPVYFFGIFSAVLVALAMGLYFVSMGHSGKTALATYLVIGPGHLILSMLVATGVVADEGLLSSRYLAPEYQVLTAILVQGLFLAIFLLGRSSRRTLLGSVQALQDATRALSQREVLLEEARQDFNRALRLGGVGRFSDATLGSYVLGEIVGRGAMGEVYRARHADTGDAAAVKVLLLEAMSQSGALERFRREAVAAASIESPHVVRVFEIGDHEAEVPFIAMELLEGEDLATRLRRESRMDRGDAVDLVAQVARGLAAAADAGVIHRDIKPQNLFRTAAGVWKVLDFGVSRLESSGGTLTQGRVVGTPSYMAPEQARGGDIDHRCDLYALGAIAYRVLTGQPAFRHRELGAVLYKVVHEMPARPTKVAPRLPDDVDLVLAIAMAKDPADRFATGAAFAAALGSALRGQLEAPLRDHAGALLSKLPWR